MRDMLCVMVFDRNKNCAIDHVLVELTEEVGVLRFEYWGMAQQRFGSLFHRFLQVHLREPLATLRDDLSLPQ